jgi:hypothetical protein
MQERQFAVQQFGLPKAFNKLTMMQTLPLAASQRRPCERLTERNVSVIRP